MGKFNARAFGTHDIRIDLNVKNHLKHVSRLIPEIIIIWAIL